MEKLIVVRADPEFDHYSPLDRNSGPLRFTIECGGQLVLVGSAFLDPDETELGRLNVYGRDRDSGPPSVYYAGSYSHILKRGTLRRASAKEVEFLRRIFRHLPEPPPLWADMSYALEFAASTGQWRPAFVRRAFAALVAHHKEATWGRRKPFGLRKGYNRTVELELRGVMRHLERYGIGGVQEFGPMSLDLFRALHLHAQADSSTP